MCILNEIKNKHNKVKKIKMGKCNLYKTSLLNVSAFSKLAKLKN